MSRIIAISNSELNRGQINNPYSLEMIKHDLHLEIRENLVTITTQPTVNDTLYHVTEDNDFRRLPCILHAGLITSADFYYSAAFV